MKLRLAYSPDADDAFMFRAAIEGLIDCEGLEFLPVTNDTQSLNDIAEKGEIDITAISVAAYPSLSDRYLLLPHGGSVGRGYGPVIVSKEPRTVESLRHATIASPGTSTTAFLVSSLILPEADFTTVPISPYEAIFDAIESGEVDAGIIIHEGRLTYQQHGLHRVVDIGEWWMKETGLPLPLGANVIRRDLDPEVIRTASRLLQQSIGWGLEHREEMIEFLIDHVHRPDEVATHDLLDRYLAMYANEETYAYREDTRRGMQELFDRGYGAGIIQQKVRAEFAPL